MRGGGGRLRGLRSVPGVGGGPGGYGWRDRFHHCPNTEAAATKPPKRNCSVSERFRHARTIDERRTLRLACARSYRYTVCTYFRSAASDPVGPAAARVRARRATVRPLT